MENSLELLYTAKYFPLWMQAKKAGLEMFVIALLAEQTNEYTTRIESLKEQIKFRDQELWQLTKTNAELQARDGMIIVKEEVKDCGQPFTQLKIKVFEPGPGKPGEVLCLNCNRPEVEHNPTNNLCPSGSIMARSNKIERDSDTRE